MATASLPVRISVVDSALISGSDTIGDRGTVAAEWGVVIEINGVDVSDDIVGEVTVEAEENAARVAYFRLHMEDGTNIALATWCGKSVQVYLVDLSSGVPLDYCILFTGVVDTPQFDPVSQTLTLMCTDNRQNVIARSGSWFVMNVGGYWSDAVFSRGPNGARANDLLSTIPVAFDLSPAGALRITNWASKPVADLSFTAADVIDGSMATDPAARSGMVNEIDVYFEYRFPRLKSEGHLLSFDPIADAMTSLGYWIKDGNYFLQRAQVVAAIEKSGGNIVSIDYIELPATPVSIPGTGGYWLPNPPVDVQYCTGFDAVVAFDYGQTISEQFTLNVACQKSIDAVGAMHDEMSGALEGVYDDPVAAEAAILLFKQKISAIPPKAYASVVNGMINAFTPPLAENTSRTAANTAMQSLVAIAQTRIHNAHRQTTVSFAVPINPVLDVDKTVHVVAGGVEAKGKVRRVVFRLDTDAGTALANVDLAICSMAGVGITHDADEPTPPAGTSDGSGYALDATVIDWNGLNGQDGVLTITFPAVAAGERDLAEHEISASYAAPIYEDLFTVTA